MKDGAIQIEVISGVEGPSLAINERRVAGPKPWGGGRVTTEWATTRRNILEAFLGNLTTMPSVSGPVLDAIEDAVDREVEKAHAMLAAQEKGNE